MAAWMLYATGLAAALALTGLLAERGLGHLGLPVRWAWAAVMAATVALPLALGLPGGGPGGPGVAAAGAAIPNGLLAASATPGPLATASGPSDLDVFLLVVWGAASAAFFVWLLLSARALRRDEGTWRPATVEGQRVLVSPDFGPGVIGALRPRIVLPRWVLELDGPARRLVTAHELEHVRARDGRLLLGGLVAVGVMPWCLPAWWQLHRLRGAVEADCDARVLSAVGRPRQYADVLVAVAGRRTARALPVASLGPTGAELERRIRRVTRGAGGSRPRGAGFVAAAAAVVVAAAAVPAPATPLGLAAALAEPELREPSRAGGEVPGPPRPDGSLPGAPDDERLMRELRAHHGDALAAGVPPGSVFWFVVGPDGAVRRTGVEPGPERQATARLRARYPAETSDYGFGFELELPGHGTTRVIWLLPPAAGRR